MIVGFINYALSSGAGNGLEDHAVITAFTKVASGIAKNTPQKPHRPPKTNTAIMMYSGCKLTASENNNGTNRFPSNA